MTALDLDRAEGRPGTTVSAGSLIATIIAKDARLYLRNRFVVFMTLLVLIVWAIVYQFLPTSVDETFPVGVVVEGSIPIDPEQLGGDLEQGVLITGYGSVDELRAAVDAGDDVQAGVVFPADFVATAAAGGTPAVTVLVPPGLPPQFSGLLESAASEIGFALSGVAPPVDLAATQVIVGTDRVGAQVSLADQMRPLLLITVLMVEVFALSMLVAGEVAERTVTAILATPANAAHMLIAKGILGTVLTFAEVVLLGVLIGAFGTGTALVLTALLLGSVLVTGLGLLVGAFGRDFMDTMVFGMVVIIPLLVPAIAALFPGSPAWWVRMLPSYGLVETVVGAGAGTIGFADAIGPLVLLAVWGVVLMALGAWTLNRRVASL